MLTVSDLFDVEYGHSLELNRLRIVPPADGIPFVSRKMRDNGVAAYVEEIESEKAAPAGSLTVALSGNGVMSTFIQDRKFYTAFHVAILTPKIELTKPQLLYYCACMKANRYRFSYGRQANRTLKTIHLPDPKDIPDWVDQVYQDTVNGMYDTLGKLIGV